MSGQRGRGPQGGSTNSGVVTNGVTKRSRFRQPSAKEDLDTTLANLREWASYVRMVQVMDSSGRYGLTDTDRQVQKILSLIEHVDLRDPEALNAVATVVSNEYSGDVLIGFLSQLEDRAPPPRPREPAVLRYYRLGTINPRGLQQVYGPGAVGPFPMAGITGRAVQGAARNAARGAENFFNGFLLGLQRKLSKHDVKALNKKLFASHLLTSVFPQVFLTGLIVGVGKDIYDAIDGVIEMISNFDAFVEQMEKLLEAIVNTPEALYGMGVISGEQLADKVHGLLKENIIVFTYEIGKLIGPALLYAVLLIIGVSAPVAIAMFSEKLLKFLRGFKTLARIFDALEDILKSKKRLPNADPKMIIQRTAHDPVGPVKTKRPDGFETGRHQPAPAPKGKSVTRQQQLDGIDLAKDSSKKAHGAKKAATKTENKSYKTAKEGGKHSGFLKNYENKTPKEIEKGTKSIKKQIAEHEDKIKNPSEHIDNWDNLDPRQQEALVKKKWPSDIARQKEQLEILEELLKTKSDGS